MVIGMGCWKWLESYLKEAGIDGYAISWPQSRGEIDEIIRQFVGEQASYGRCSSDWEKAGIEIQTNEQMKQELSKKLRLLYLKWIDHFEYKRRLMAKTKPRNR